MFQGIDPNYHPNPDPATATSPEGRRVRFPNCIRSDTGRVIEEAPEGVVYRFSTGGSDKLRPANLGRSDPALTFSTAYIIIAPIWTTSVFLVTSFC